MAHPFPDLVSVLIRSTARPELTKALESVAAQTYSTIEVIIVDASGKNAVVAPANYSGLLRIISPDYPMQRSKAANELLDSANGQCFSILAENKLDKEKSRITRE